MRYRINFVRIKIKRLIRFINSKSFQVFYKDHSKFFQEVCYTENEKERCVLEDFTNENDSSSVAETKERNAFFVVLHRKYIMQVSLSVRTETTLCHIFSVNFFL